MVKKAVKVEVNNFIKGLITEASPLNFPANASFDEENFELSHTGTRARRLGMDMDPGGGWSGDLSTPEEVAATPPVTYTWKGAGGNEDLTIAVLQIGTALTFYDMSSFVLNSGFLGSVTVSTIDSTVQPAFTSVDGKLVIADGSDTVAVVVYEGGVFSVSYKDLLTRDVWGVEETAISSYETDPSYRGATSDQHTYNLQNQSWGIPRKNAAGTLVDPADQYNTDLSVYPSNSEVVWTGLQFQPSATPFERMYTNLYEEVLGADTKAPKGYFIINVLNRGTSREAAFAANNTKYPTLVDPSINIANDTTTSGPTVISEFAGRVWYGGFSGEVTASDKRSPNLSNYIFFSQLVKNVQDVSKCYQEGDPTSRENSEIVDTDGGFVRISGMNKLLSMVNLGSAHIIIADNGVWAIVGGSDYGFTPTNYKVEKLSSYGGIGKHSYVEQLGRLFYWGEDGIYVVAKNQFGDYEVTSITETTIQTFYESLPTIAKEQAVGIYDEYGKKIRWLVKTGVSFEANDILELVFDVVINAFSKMRIYPAPDGSIELFSIFPPVKEFQQPRYLAIQNTNPIQYGFAYYNDVEWRDWGSMSGGTDAAAFVLTGAQTGGDSSIPKQLPYVTLHFYRTESGVDENLVPQERSSCFMQVRWDWSYASTSNKWSRIEQVYRYRKPRFVTGPDDGYDTGFEIVTSKNKVRGRGKAFAMKLFTEPYRDCKIVGWNLSADANSIT